MLTQAQYAKFTFLTFFRAIELSENSSFQKVSWKDFVNENFLQFLFTE